MECAYNIYFRNHRVGHRIMSVPILKDTCSCCEDRFNCKISIYNKNVQQDELDKALKVDLLNYKKYLEESIRQYKDIEKDIRNGKYAHKWQTELLRLSDAPDNAIVNCGTEKMTVKEYLEMFPSECDTKRIVGIKPIEKVSDVVYGLNINDLLEDLEYTKKELSKI